MRREGAIPCRVEILVVRSYSRGLQIGCGKRVKVLHNQKGNRKKGEEEREKVGEEEGKVEGEKKELAK